MRTFAIAFLGLLALLTLSGPAFAEDKPVMVQAVDTFPATLGYAALAAGGTIGGILCTVIGKLWFSLGAKDASCQASIDAVKKEKQDAIDTIKKDMQAEVDRLRDRLEVEQKDRREEAERLLREQKDIMREVMTLAASIPPALGQMNKTIELLVHRVEDLAEAVGRKAA